MKPIHMLGGALGALLAGAWLTYAFVGAFGDATGFSSPNATAWLLGGVVGFLVGGLALAGAASPPARRLAFYTAAAIPLGGTLVLATAGGHVWLLACLPTAAALLLYAPALREVRRTEPAVALA